MLESLRTIYYNLNMYKRIFYRLVIKYKAKNLEDTYNNDGLRYIQKQLDEIEGAIISINYKIQLLNRLADFSSIDNITREAMEFYKQFKK